VHNAVIWYGPFDETAGGQQMPAMVVSGGTVHEVPGDLRKALRSDAKTLAAWQDITPLARNEWICWVESTRKPETRQQHVERAIADLGDGKRRPCCWYGCIHRTDKAVSPSVRGMLAKRARRAQSPAES